MAKKNDQAPAENEQAPVEKATTKPATADLESRHIKLRTERRELEAELAAIDGKLRDAINDGDLEALDSLTARKAELPRIFIAASIAETTARQAIVNAADQANLKLLEVAEAEREKIYVALVKRQREYEAEIAALKEKLLEADHKVGSLYTTLAASRDLGASHDAGFKKSLAALAGV